MKVSIVIPAYNEEQYIGHLLKALVNQTIVPDEIIVVDNGCTDRTVEIAKEYNVRVIKEKKQGIVFARNTGFDAAQYDLIIRFDADTVPPPHYIEHIKKTFEKEKIIALSAKVKFYGLPSLLPPFLIELPFNSSVKLVLNHEALLGINTVMLRKYWLKVRDEVCTHAKNIHEDLDLAIHLSQYGQIKMDSSVTVLTSSRRINKKPKSFFVDYTMMMFNTILYHQKFLRQVLQ